MIKGTRCPKCGSKTRLGTSTKDGRQFHVCVNYPECRGKVAFEEDWDDNWDEESSPSQSQESAPSQGAFCRGCGLQIHVSTTSCPHCGARIKSKEIYGFLALFLGSIGIHRLYLGQWRFLFYFFFSWTVIPGIVSLIEGAVALCQRDEAWFRNHG